MEYKNHKITEAVCAFRFDPNQNISSDLTFFADYYRLIKLEGFEKKQEIKPFQLNFNINTKEGTQSSEMLPGDTQMVFKTLDDMHAILMGNNYISFHSLNHYPGWDVFSPNIVDKFIEIYFSMGLGKGLQSAQMIFINNFDIEKERTLSDYLVFVPQMKGFGQGDELSHVFQSNYAIKPNKQLSLKTILNIIDDTKKVTLESNCIANNIGNVTDWKELIKDAHDNAKNAFVNIASEYFKQVIN